MSSQKTIQINEIMSKSIETIGLSSTARDVAIKMKEKRVSSILVIDDDNGTPQGMITERDLSIKVCTLDKSSKEVPSNQIMSSPVITINEESSPSDAAELMLKHKVRHLLVVPKESGQQKNKNENAKVGNKNTIEPSGIITPMDLTRFEFNPPPTQEDENSKIKILLDHYRHDFDYFL